MVSYSILIFKNSSTEPSLQFGRIKDIFTFCLQFKIIDDSRLLSYRVLQNYEVKSNSFTDNDEVIENANREGSLKINPDDEITSNIIFRAVRDLFGDSVKKANKRVDRSYKRVFLNLSKREKILEESNNETEEEWKKLQGNASAIAKEAGDGEWQVLVSDECLLSFARFENGRCDGRVMVCEVKFIKSNTRKRIET